MKAKVFCTKEEPNMELIYKRPSASKDEQLPTQEAGGVTILPVCLVSTRSLKVKN